MYGIEIGTGKERQSNSFMLKTGIPTISLDTRNSRTDRCPICLRWICYCPVVIDLYADIDYTIENVRVKCLEICTSFEPHGIARGDCPYTKYNRDRINAEHSHHEYANGLHYHYQCVLDNVSDQVKRLIIQEEDETALKTHFPDYKGLEALINDVSES